jgi:multiple antibiotic resistance protein
MLSKIFPISFAFFLLMDALGNVPLFLSLLKEVPSKRRSFIILREMLIALFIIIIFYFLGDLLLDFLYIQQHTILMAGGIILFLIALRMVFPEFIHKDTSNHPLSKEPFIVPLAIPLVAGPAILASVMLYSQQQESPIIILSALFLAWLSSTLILLSSGLLQKVLKERGLIACERLMGLLLTLMSVQMFLEGVSLYLCEVNQSLLLNS